MFEVLGNFLLCDKTIFYISLIVHNLSNVNQLSIVTTRIKVARVGGSIYIN